MEGNVTRARASTGIFSHCIKKSRDFLGHLGKGYFITEVPALRRVFMHTILVP